MLSVKQPEFGNSSNSIVHPIEQEYNTPGGQSQIITSYASTAPDSCPHSTPDPDKFATYLAASKEFQQEAARLYKDAYYCDPETKERMELRADVLSSWAAVLFSIPEVQRLSRARYVAGMIALGFWG